MMCSFFSSIFVLLQLDLVRWLNVQILCSNKQSIDIHAEILTRVGQSQEFEELRIIQEEESAEDQALLLEELMHLLLKNLEVLRHFFEDLDS
jgi:hypothetical protein